MQDANPNSTEDDLRGMLEGEFIDLDAEEVGSGTTPVRELSSYLHDRISPTTREVDGISLR